MDQEKNIISKPTFEIIKMCLEINLSLSTSELSNKILEEKWVKIRSEEIYRYLISQNYKYESINLKKYILMIYLNLFWFCQK